jgi:hypothetical protein
MPDGMGREPFGFFTVQEALALVAYGDPAALEKPDADEADREARLHKADRELCDEIAEGGVTLLGRRGVAEGKGRFFPGIHEAVPAETFLNERRTFLWAWGWAALHCAPGVPWDEWLHHRVARDDPDWGDLRFPKADLLARFPLRAAEMKLLPVQARAPSTPSEKVLPLTRDDAPAEVNAPPTTMPLPGSTGGASAAPVAMETPRSVAPNPRLLSAEYIARVEWWKAARAENPDLRSPSEENDWTWAQTRFGRVPRTKVRALRAKYAPESWRKSGKRSGAIWRE